MIRRPNLFVIGAMKSGTTALCQCLGEHPAIYMSPVKEPMHFSRGENWSRGNEEYLRLFRGASREVYLAEGSTEYTKRPFREGVAERIHRFNPEARLIYVMRDPFGRLVSEYRHQVGMGREREPLVQALKRPTGYLLHGHYAYQLRPYLDCFGRKAVYLDTFESFISSPSNFCARLFGWLGIDSSFLPPSAGQQLNANPDVMEVLNEDSPRVRMWRSLRRRSRLARLVPAPLRRWYRATLPRQFWRHADPAELRREIEAARRSLRPLVAGWIQELEQLTGRSYEEWPSTRTGTELREQNLPPLEVWLPDEVKSRDDSAVG